MEWNDGVYYWSGILDWTTGVPRPLHNLSKYSCMEVTVKLSLTTSMQVGAVTKNTVLCYDCSNTTMSSILSSKKASYNLIGILNVA